MGSHSMQESHVEKRETKSLVAVKNNSHIGILILILCKSRIVILQPACRMRDTPWRPHCVTHRSPVTCRGPSPGLGEAKGDPHWRQGSVEEALRSAPWTPLTLRRACRAAWPTPQRGKCLTLLFLNNKKPHNMLLTFPVRSSLSFYSTSSSRKCLVGTRVESVVYVHSRHLQLRGDAAILIRSGNSHRHCE